MKIGTFTIHDNPGKVFDCACVIGVEADGETVALRFPQIEQAEDNLSPMLYATMRGTELRICLCDRDDVQITFAWDESESTWRKIIEQKESK